MAIGEIAEDEEEEVIKPATGEKRRLNDVMLTSSPVIRHDDAYVPDDDDDDDDDDYDEGLAAGEEAQPLTDEQVNAMVREDLELDKQLLTYTLPYQPLDVAGAFIIAVHLPEIRRMGFDLHSFRRFHFECRDARTLQLYDHPGDPRMGGFYHYGGQHIEDEDRDIARFAIKSFNGLPQDIAKLELHEVDMVTCRPDCDPFYYVTFRAIDAADNELKVYQAQILESDDYVPEMLLGMLRDVHKNRVLAVLEQVPTKDFDAALGLLPKET